ncbi:zinc finger protein 106 [Rhinichthys klamathensis goyatoka]|uniref:zinc finger protein 106 n=1 Tax=Rhinichthys klamathensis goyatoka TaxID=3034132 RepID=UPI0024B56523|nr:zinc finger protein 106 [Rhinichthys klamathensis goyatoka]
MKSRKKGKRSGKPQTFIYTKCLICGEQYGDKNLDTHMHSYVHHEAVEHLKGSEQLHKCLACDVSVLGLELYKEHIATRKHTYSLYKLHNRRRKEQKYMNYHIDLTDEEFLALQIERKKKIQKCTETCFVCCQIFPIQDLDAHMHSIVHHQAIEELKGSPQVHKCWACDMTKTGMAQFKVHIRTLYHKYMLFELQKITADGKTVDYSAEIDDELRAFCYQRDQQMQEKKREKTKKWKQAKLKRAQLLKSKENTSEIGHSTIPVIDNEEFTNGQLPQSCRLFVSWENQNDLPASFQLNQNLPKQRQESILDMDRSNGPLVKKPRLENPSDNLPQEMSAHGTPTPEIEDGTSAGPTCAPGLVQSRMEANKPNLTATKGTCSAQKATTKNEAVIPKPPLQKRSRSKKSMRKVNKAESQSNKQGTTREGMNGQEPHVDSLPSGTSLNEMFESQTSGNDCQAVEVVENVRPQTVHVKKKKSNACDTEQGETSLVNSFETNSCNVQKNKKKKQDISHNNLNPKTNDKTSRKRKVKKLLTLSSKEDKLTSSLEDVGDELFLAYSTMQSAYTEVQRLLAVKQQVTSEMASLRTKRIKILQDMKNPTHSDQQVGLNAS